MELEGDPTVQSGCRLSATADPQTGAPARGAGRMRTLKTPTFVIKNNTPINAQDVRIKLSAPKYDGTALTNSAPSFQNGRRFIWTKPLHLGRAQLPARTEPDWVFFDERKAVHHAIRGNLHSARCLEFCRLVLHLDDGDAGGCESEPYYFDLQIGWSIPENSKPARYRVKAVATNTKPPTADTLVFSAEIEFSVEPED